MLARGAPCRTLLPCLQRLYTARPTRARGHALPPRPPLAAPRRPCPLLRLRKRRLWSGGTQRRRTRQAVDGPGVYRAAGAGVSRLELLAWRPPVHGAARSCTLSDGKGHMPILGEVERAAHTRANIRASDAATHSWTAAPHVALCVRSSIPHRSNRPRRDIEREEAHLGRWQIPERCVHIRLGWRLHSLTLFAARSYQGRRRTRQARVCVTFEQSCQGVQQGQYAVIWIQPWHAESTGCSVKLSQRGPLRLARVVQAMQNVNDVAHHL